MQNGKMLAAQRRGATVRDSFEAGVGLQDSPSVIGDEYAALCSEGRGQNTVTLFLLVALGAKRPRLDAAVREGIIAAWREMGRRYAVAMWARQKSFAGSLQRSFITALALLRVAKTPMRLVSSYTGAMDFFETIETIEPGVRDAWRSMLESVEDFQESSD